MAFPSWLRCHRPMCPSCSGPPLSQPPAAFSPPPTCPGSAPRERPAYLVASGQLRTAPPAERLADARTACSFTPCCAAVTATRQSRDPAVTPHNRHERQSSATLPPLRAMPLRLASSGSLSACEIVTGSAAGPTALASLASCQAPHRGSLRRSLGQPLRGPPPSRLRLPLFLRRLRRVSGSARAASGPPLPPPPPLGSPLTASFGRSSLSPLGSPLSLWSGSRV